MYRISIIIPVYNVENYLERCIQSIIKQITSNDEIILVDDASTDSSGEICKAYEKEYENIHYYKQAKNSGTSKTRNLGLERVRGKYICFLDSDDFVEDNYIEVMLKNIQNYDLVICAYYFVYDSKKEKRIISMPSQKMDDKNIVQLFKNKEMLNSPCNKMYRTEIIKKNQITFDESESRGEDLLFNLDYIYYAKNNIFIIDKPLYNYIMKNTGLNLGLEEKLKKRFKRVRKVSCKMKKINNSFKVTQIVLYTYLFHIYLHLKNKINKGRM